MTMFNITDGKNNISHDKPVEHIDFVIGLHVSACTSCDRHHRVYTESVQLLVCFKALRSMPVIWRLLHWPHRPLQQMRERGRASPANVKSGWPGPIPKCHACIGPPHRPRPARTRARTIARTTARTHARTRGMVRLHKCPHVFTPGTRMRARDGG